MSSNESSSFSSVLQGATMNGQLTSQATLQGGAQMPVVYDPDTVKYTEQTKTDDEKAVARQNINAMSADFVAVTGGSFLNNILTLTRNSGQGLQIPISTEPNYVEYLEGHVPPSITLQNNTEYYAEKVSTLAINFPSGNFDSLIEITTASSGTVNITIDNSALYIGEAPEFSTNERWEISVHDGVVIAAKVGDGT